MREFLIKNGEVFLLRGKNRRPSSERRHAVIGTRLTGTTPLGFDVILELVSKKVNEDTYAKYLDKSGFDSVEEWKASLSKQYPSHIDALRLYRARICGESWN